MEKLHRWIAAGLVFAGMAGVMQQAAAQEWSPNRPVRIIVPIVGSTNDALARIVAEKLQAAIGQPVYVENKPGAGGNIGADMVAKSAPDGHTLLVGYNGPLAINVTLFDKIPYDPLKDLAPITLAVTSPQYLAVPTALPVKNVADLLAMARADPAKLSYGSVAVGSASHLTMEMLKLAAKVNLTHVPYKGASPAVTDLVAGNVQAAFMVPGNVQQFAKDGRLRLIASSGQKRFASTPDVPTMIESGFPDFIATSWIGFLAAGGTPKNIIDRYNKEIVAILQLPDVRAKLRDMEFEVIGSTPQQFSDWIRAEIPRWGRVIRETGTKAN
ncbi:MAG: tripartite tricarboxylate transporter substrate binding protein [Paucimonas sp.]|jgi:tripartite-type tricarboxylate transporter receptor subunit TctC|nr:tripartite tricarboxylate transporter substrate binding protein [Paucimonas sp.]